MQVLLGVEWWPEPAEQPADRTTLQQYDVDEFVLARWRRARKEYLNARAVLIRRVERQGWRATSRPCGDGCFVDIVFTGPPGQPFVVGGVEAAPDAPRFIEIEDDQRRSIQYGEWVERDDGTWALRVPAR